MQADDTRNYHHGRLREALLDGAFELARKDGPSAVVLRSVARTTGVSHNAAYRHFADRDALLHAVAERCMAALAAVMRERTAQVRAADDVERAWLELAAIGRGYIEFAMAEPGMFRTAFAAVHRQEVGTDDAASFGGGADGSPGPFGLLTGALDLLVEVGALPVQRRPGAEHAAWSAVHGLSELLAGGPLAGLPAPEKERAIQVVLDTVSRGL